MTEIFSPKEIQKAVTALAAGKLVAFPTETVYGLGADATNETAVKQVYAAKGRPSDNPLIVHVNNIEMVSEYAANVSPAVKKLVKTFWPGPLTIILPIKPHALSKAVTGGLDTVAFRNPDNALTLALISKLGRPIVGPSANTSTKPSPTKAQHVAHDLDGKIAGILDGGETRIGVESTVLDMSVAQPIVLRPGAITPEQIGTVINQKVLLNRGKVADQEIPKAPGMKYRHYAPSAQVIVVDDPKSFAALPLDDETIGVAATNEVLQPLTAANSYSLGNDVKTAAHNLFAALRYFDDQKRIKTIYVEGFSNSSLSTAYMNRLNKAAAGKHLHA